MTTPNRQLPQVKSNTQIEGAKGTWYRSPTVWLGIVITVVIFVGCVQFLLLAADIRKHENAHNLANTSNTESKTTKKKELTHILGVPISASSLAKPEQSTNNTAEANDGESSDHSL